MKTLISACLVTAVLIISSLPTHASRNYSSQEEHRNAHREQVLNK
jgi:hypothetical protein